MITQTVRILNNQVTPVYFYSESIFSGLFLYQYSLLPAWIVEAGFQPYVELLVMSPTATGTFTYYFTLSTSPAAQDACLIVEVVDSLTDSVDTCSTDASICLLWFNREGGMSSFVFDERKNFGATISKGKIYNSNKTLKYLDRGKFSETKKVYKTGLTNDQTDFLDSLIFSVQAWEYVESTGICTPILIEEDSYSKYNTKEKLNEFSLSYKIATYKNSQNG